MKMELTEKEVEMIGQDRWGNEKGYKWRKWFLLTILIWFASGLGTWALPQIVRIPLIIGLAMPIILCLVLWDRKKNKAGKDFLEYNRDMEV